MIYVPLAVVFLAGLRRLSRSGWGAISESRGGLLLVAYVLLSAPAVLFVLSHLVTPVFSPRYFLPSGIGLAIVLAATADALGSDSNSRTMPRLLWQAVVYFLLISPLLTVRALGSQSLYRGYLDVQRVEQIVRPNVAVVVGWQEDFAKLMRYARSPNPQYYFLLDWPAALVGPRAFVLDYHLMQAYRNNGYYSKYIQDSHAFLCSHPDFLVLDAPNANTLDAPSDNSPDMQKPNWFDVNVRRTPQFEWKVIASFDATEVTRKLITVHRSASLPFCNQP